MDAQIKSLLGQIIHPETNLNLIEGGYITSIKHTEDSINIIFTLRRAHDPFAVKIKKAIASMLETSFPGFTVSVTIAEPMPQGAKAQHKPKDKGHNTDGICNIIAISSGKGGVGKSTVTANLAVKLMNMGYKVGILDADIYGPSQPRMFGVEGEAPGVEGEGEENHILPIEVSGIKLMSIGFFVKPTDALIWRGAMATNALRQMIHQTRWGKLDYLLIDLPPGTGDIHLSIIGELKIDGAVVVSTPQQIAVADVVRGIEMFRAEKIAIPVLGVIENMAYFTPKELPENKYYIFGRGGARECAEKYGVDLLGEIPIIQSIMDEADSGKVLESKNSDVDIYYRAIAQKIVEKCHKEC